jgi:hypothetical protein
VTFIHWKDYRVLIMAPVRAAAEPWASEVTISQLQVIGPALGLPSPFKAEVILISVLGLILAHIWSYGLDFKRDRTLTS